METLRAAYRVAKANNGAPGMDGVTLEDMEASGVEPLLEHIRDELVARPYHPRRGRRKAIPQDGGTKVRVLGMPTIRDRVVQGALKLLLESIVEADVQPGSYGYRPKRSAHAAGERVAEAMVSWKTRVLDVDLQGYFDLREALAVLHVTINEEKSRMVDLAHGETFSCLGCDFRRVKSRRGVWRPWYTPRLKKRTALRRKLKEIFRRDASQPVERVVALINPIVRGWGRSFAVGDSSRCFGCIKDGVAKKVRRHLRRARNRKGLGWKRWRRRGLEDPLGLFHHYRVSRPQPKALPVR